MPMTGATVEQLEHTLAVSIQYGHDLEKELSELRSGFTIKALVKTNAILVEQLLQANAKIVELQSLLLSKEIHHSVNLQSAKRSEAQAEAT
jgi:S-adenosylmethionine synthetase